MPSDAFSTSLLRAKELQRSQALANLYIFASEVLGYTDLQPQPHEEMCNFLESLTFRRPDTGVQTKGMLLVPRGCFKTTIGAISLAILLLSQNPNLRILITAHTHDYAKEILDGIRNQLERNAKLKTMFGDWRAGATMWSDEAITIGTRTDPTIKEPSIATAGVDKAKTGGHYDIIIADDLHSEKNIDSDGLRRRVRRHIQTLYPIMEPQHGVLLLIGTRWHNSDAYAWILRLEAEAEKKGQPPEWIKLIRSAYLPDGALYFPARITEAVLTQARRNLEDKLYSVWFLNQSMEEGSKVFPRSWWQFWDGEFSVGYYPVISTDEGKQVPVYVTIAIDPSYSDRTGRGYNGITVVGNSPEEDWYILEAIRLKGAAADVLSTILYLVQKYWPRKVTIENVAFRDAYQMLLRKEFKERDIHVPVVEYREALRKDKPARIEALQPRFKQRKIFLRRGLDDLYQELEDWPETDHNDILDSLAQHASITKPADPGEFVVIEEEEVEVEAEVREGPVTSGMHVGLGTPEYVKRPETHATIEPVNWFTLKRR